MDDTGRGANVHDGIAYGESYYIRITTNEKRLITWEWDECA
ncbi:hypothetical protein [Prevotella histicola]|nr:hypothetical protein [Prevotella histicola]